MRFQKWLASAFLIWAGSAIAADPLPPAPVRLTPVLAAPTYTSPTPPMYVPHAPIPFAEPLPSGVIADEWEEAGVSMAWGRAEYLFWSLTGGNVPALIGTSPAGTPVALAGVPNAPNTRVLFGGSDLLDEPRSGARVSVGTWLESSRRFGVEASAFWLNGDTIGASYSSDGSTILASSPFINALNGVPSAVLIGFPGVVAGTTSVEYEAKSFMSAEILARFLLCSGPGWRVDGLFGTRCYQYSERLDIRKTVYPLGAQFTPGTSIVCNDSIEAENEFCGAVLGFDCQTDFCGFTFSARPSVAVGIMENRVNREGITIINVLGNTPLVYPGGTYNLNSNLGEVSSRDWTAIPSLDLRVSKQVVEHLRLSVGYSGTYFPSLARAGEQIDQRVNPNLIPPAIPGGPPLPAPLLERNSAILHGFTLGAEFRF